MDTQRDHRRIHPQRQLKNVHRAEGAIKTETMKQGHRNMIGLFAALMGMSASSKGLTPKEATGNNIGVSHYNEGANPLYFGKSQKKRKTNKLNRSHKLRLKHKRAA